MKVCPTCQTKYTDALEYCMQDGTVLTELPDPNATLRLESRPTQSTIPTTGRGFTFGALAIGGAALGVVLVVVFASAGYLIWSKSGPSSNSSSNPSVATQTNRESVKAEPTKADVAKKIEQINDEIGFALNQADLATLDRLLAEDYTYQNDLGLRLTKQQILNHFRTGNLSYDYVTSTKPTVEVNDNLSRAVLTARGHNKGQFLRRAFNDNVAYQNTYEKRSSGWQLVSGMAWYR